MGKIKRKFDIQFKVQICQSIEAGGRTVRQVCQEHQLQKVTVERWLQKYVSNTLESQAGGREREMEREIEKLRAKVGELTMTLDLLKKTQSFRAPSRGVNPLIVTSRSWDQSQKVAKDLVSPRPPTTTNLRRTQ